MVQSTHYLGPERRLHGSVLHVDPVDGLEEGVVLDGLLAAVRGHAAQALRHVFVHELKLMIHLLPLVLFGSGV